MLNILECTPIAQFAIGLDHKVTHWNRTCELLTGYSSSELIGTDRQWVPFYPYKRPVLADLIVIGELGKFEEFYQGKGVSKSDVIPTAWQATDYFENLGGESRHIFSVAAPAVDLDGKIVGAVETLQDITPWVKAERALKVSEQRYRMLTEKVADGIILIQDRRLMFANSVSAEMLGYDGPDELVGQKTVNFIAEDFREAHRIMSQGFYAGEFREKVVKMKCLKADGREIWLEAHNEFIEWEGKPAILSTLRDITESRIHEIAVQAEAALLRKENKLLKYAARDRYRFGNIVGKSRVMQEIYDVILKAAATDENVIVYGESGTGKELVARAIHEMSDRKKGEFVPVNCGAIPGSLIESEFFGHKRGAFTGAVVDTYGYLALAHGGVLFLDEIGDLPLNMQVKLLRVVEGRGYSPVGSNRTEMSDFRIVAATNKDLKELVHSGLMREDFFYRMHVIPIQIPPLRDRKEDLALLVDHFLKTHDKGKKEFILPEKILEALFSYDWPGNVRELENLLRRYLAIGHLDFPGIGFEPANDWENVPIKASKWNGMSLATAVERFEKDMVVSALQQHQWHKAKAAAHLGISRRTLFRKIKNMARS